MNPKLDKPYKYNSFKLYVPKSQTDTVLNDCFWPEGVSFRKFVFIKPKETDKATDSANKPITTSHG